MASIDVTVRGAGAFGLSIAWACVRRGARVRVIDPGGPGAGSSGGVVGALAPHVPENWNDKKAFQLESLLMAPEWWANVRSAGGADPGYCHTGRLQPVDEGAEPLARARERAAGAATLWQGRAQWEVIPAAEGWGPVSPSGWWIRDTLSAHLNPSRACAALAAAITAFGGEVTRDGEEAGALVLATGAAGLEALNKELGRSVGAPIKGQAAVLEHDARGAPQIFAGGVHVIPHADGTVAIGSTTEREFDGLGTDEALDEVIAKAREAVPALADAAVIRRWAGLRPRARSRAPMLGPHPLRHGTFIANGGFKIGFGMAPLAGERMADLVLTGRAEIPEGFRVGASL